MNDGLRVTIWNEGYHEKNDSRVQELYPKGIGGQLADYLEQQPGIASVQVVTMDSPDQGVSDEVLDNTDVMTWWGHKIHHELTDEHAAKVHAAVVERGMGLVPLHSAHFSKPFISLMGTSCSLKWREYKGIGERERLWVVNPGHPIVDGVPEMIELERAEMYGEHFDIPQPDQLVFISWFRGGEVFRSGCCWHRGLGKVFYFRPGHETLPIYYNEHILRVIYNGIRWAAPVRVAGGITRRKFEPLETDMD